MLIYNDFWRWMAEREGEEPYFPARSDIRELAGKRSAETVMFVTKLYHLTILSWPEMVFLSLAANSTGVYEIGGKELAMGRSNGVRDALFLLWQLRIVTIATLLALSARLLGDERQC